MRDKWVKVRINDDERAYWHEKAQASGRTLSDLIREALVRVRAYSPKDKEIEQARLRELTRIGTNLNQIAKWANVYKSSADAVQVISALVALDRDIKALFPIAPMSKATDKDDNLC